MCNAGLCYVRRDFYRLFLPCRAECERRCGVQANIVRQADKVQISVVQADSEVIRFTCYLNTIGILSLHKLYNLHII